MLFVTLWLSTCMNMPLLSGIQAFVSSLKVSQWEAHSRVPDFLQTLATVKQTDVSGLLWPLCRTLQGPDGAISRLRDGKGGSGERAHRCDISRSLPE